MPETQEVTEAKTEAKTESKEVQRPANLPDNEEWERVDFEKDPPEKIEKRFNRVFRSLRETQGALTQAARDNRAIADKLAEIERKAAEKEHRETVAALKREKVSALEKGESEKVVDIDERLSTLKPPEVKPHKVEEPSWFDAGKQAELAKWVNAEEDGKPVRPWASPDHPKYERLVDTVNAVLRDPEFAGAEMDEILGEVDRLMAPAKKQAPVNPVLSGRTGIRQEAGGKVALSEQQKMVARKMYQDMDPAEAYKRYTASIKSLGGN